MTSDTYSRDAAQRTQSVSPGRITTIRNVTIEGDARGGALVGGLAGGVLGSYIGSGSAANALGAVGGSMAGAAVGSNVQQSAGSRAGLEISVRLDVGETIAVTQEVNPRETFQVGERVRVLSDGATTRVTH